jgi:hypothetical protein
MTDILNGLVELISLLLAAGEVRKPSKCLWRRARRRPAKMRQVEASRDPLPEFARTQLRLLADLPRPPFIPL